MEKNLLLGNGINAHLGVNGMNMLEIADRFADCLVKSSDLFDLMFDVRFTPQICQELYSKTEKRGIESLTAIIYDYIASKVKGICINDRMRIIDAIICCAITAIFYKGSEKLGSDYNVQNLPRLDEYSNIYTLNYVEFWDENEKCKYLHGKYDIASVRDNGKEVLHHSLERKVGYKGYGNVVKRLENKFNMCELYTRDIVFSPELYKKSEMIAMGSYPSEHLYPDTDYFLHDLKPLYEELDSIHEIEVFGMSPYGDEDIIRKLNAMNKAIIYVYDYKNNKESQDWDRVLTCSHEIKDSMDIMI